MGIREHGVVAADSFLEGAVEAFNFWDMLVTGGNIEHHMEVCNVATYGFELVVGKDDDGAKPVCDVCTNDSLEVLDDVTIFHTAQLTS